MTVQNMKQKPIQVFHEDGRHCLMAADGRVTGWAAYQSIAYLDGWVGHTAYYGAHEDVVTSDEFCKEFAAYGGVVFLPDGNPADDV